MDDYVLILYYSTGGKTFDLAKQIAEGVESTSMQALIRTVPRVGPTFDKDATMIPENGAVYATQEEFANAKGLALGSPTRFGNMAAPMKYFLDQTGSSWMNGAMVNKPACVFTSTSTMHGGQESTLLSMMIPLLHHGMIMLGLPYSLQQLNSTTTGGGPYGVSHFSGLKNENDVSKDEIDLAFAQGKRLAEVALAMQKA